MTPDSPWHLNLRTYFASAKLEAKLEIFASDLSIQDKIKKKHNKPSNEYNKYHPFIQHLQEEMSRINKQALDIYAKTPFPEDLKVKL